MSPPREPPTRPLSADEVASLLAPLGDEAPTRVFRPAAPSRGGGPPAQPARERTATLSSGLVASALPPRRGTAHTHAATDEGGATLPSRRPAVGRARLWRAWSAGGARGLRVGLGVLCIIVVAARIWGRASASRQPAVSPAVSTAGAAVHPTATKPDADGEGGARGGARPPSSTGMPLPSARATPQLAVVVDRPAEASAESADTSQPAIADSAGARAAVDALLSGRDREALDRYRALSSVAGADPAFRAVAKLLQRELRCGEEAGCDQSTFQPRTGSWTESRARAASEEP